MNQKVADALVAYRYITETMGDISLEQVENLKQWGMIPEGVKNHEIHIDVEQRTVVYYLVYNKAKRPAEDHVEIYFKPLSKAAQLLLGDTWEITWYKGDKKTKKLIYREPRRKPLVKTK
jgi:hypothetical protein